MAAILGRLWGPAWPCTWSAPQQSPRGPGGHCGQVPTPVSSPTLRPALGGAGWQPGVGGLFPTPGPPPCLPRRPPDSWGGGQCRREARTQPGDLSRCAHLEGGPRQPAPTCALPCPARGDAALLPVCVQRARPPAVPARSAVNCPAALWRQGLWKLSSSLLGRVLEDALSPSMGRAPSLSLAPGCACGHFLSRTTPSPALGSRCPAGPCGTRPHAPSCLLGVLLRPPFHVSVHLCPPHRDGGRGSAPASLNPSGSTGRGQAVSWPRLPCAV